MESRFGIDFSNVKIHTSNAIQLSRELNTQAFIVGNEIYFNEGKYSPKSNKGKHLLAYQLTHTIQQKRQKHIKRKLNVSKPNAKTMGSKMVTNKQEARRQIKLFSSLYSVNSSGEVIPINRGSLDKKLSTQLQNICLQNMTNSTVKIENKIADEIVGENTPDRGLHTDPHQGKSFGKVTIANYPYGESSISSSLNIKKMRTIIRFLKKNRLLKVDIIGHSDKNGNTDRISQSRARKLAKLLRKNRVYKNQIKTLKGVGARDCKLSGKNNKCRKTEVFMYIYEAAREK
jgi:outer membrane protein OmpA-like peptidoglycan-associated protein